MELNEEVTADQAQLGQQQNRSLGVVRPFNETMEYFPGTENHPLPQDLPIFNQENLIFLGTRRKALKPDPNALSLPETQHQGERNGKKQPTTYLTIPKHYNRPSSPGSSIIQRVQEVAEPALSVLPTPDQQNGGQKKPKRKINWLRALKSAVGEYKLQKVTKASDLEDVIVDLLSDEGKVSVGRFWRVIKSSGLLPSDPRLQECRKNFIVASQESSGDKLNDNDFILSEADFKRCIQDNIWLIVQAFKKDMIIPDFENFANQIKGIHQQCEELNSVQIFLDSLYRNCINEMKAFLQKTSLNDETKLHIPSPEAVYAQVSRCLPNMQQSPVEKWAVAVCTTDGQRVAYGDSKTRFSLHSCSNLFNYGLAISELGSQEVHKWVGFEPTDGASDKLSSLNHDGKPHNAIINAGAIVTLSLIKRGLTPSKKFDYIFSKYWKLAGGEHVGFNNSGYLLAKERSDRNFAIAHYLKENKCFPADINVEQVLELFFQVERNDEVLPIWITGHVGRTSPLLMITTPQQGLPQSLQQSLPQPVETTLNSRKKALASIEVTPESGAVMAATLANGGICPITGVRVLAAEAVRTTLSLIRSCGLYDYSGQFAFQVGLPAKSSRDGCLLLVVPNVMGICTYGPNVNSYNNSIKGLKFCEELVNVFNFHNYDLLSEGSERNDPTLKQATLSAYSVVNLLFGASKGDEKVIMRFALSKMNMSAQDYDGRTALHVAAAEGHLNVVRMLVERCKVDCFLKDRYGQMALDDALRFGHDDIYDYLEEIIGDSYNSTEL